MSNVRGTVTIGGSTPLTSGITQTSTGNRILGIDKATNDLMFEHGIFGVSVTRFDELESQSWAVEVYSNILGYDVLIAGVTAIGTTSTSLIGISQFLGTSANATGFVGIPCPTSVDIIGSSTAVGTTFGCVVTLSLHNSE